MHGTDLDIVYQKKEGGGGLYQCTIYKRGDKKLQSSTKGFWRTLMSFMKLEDLRRTCNLIGGHGGQNTSLEDVLLIGGHL